MTLCLGAISGTSCDGVDLVLAECNGNEKPKLINSLHRYYPQSIQEKLHHLIETQMVTLDVLARLDVEIANFFSLCVNDLLAQQDIPNRSISCIGSHGQTIYHQPNPPHANTIQIGSPAVLAAKTGIPVVNQFRQLDVAHGGQGAPLAPAIHRALFYTGKPVAVINLGGIANISGFDAENTYGYDCGPANCLMDGWIHKHKGVEYDAHGQWASQGQVDSRLLDSLKSEPFLQLAAPKSTGRELFNQHWLSSHLNGFDILAEDVQATLLEFTANTVLQGLDLLPYSPTELILCGGGVRNDLLIQRIKSNFSGVVVSTDSLGYDSDFIEALLFAWLGYLAMEKKQLNLKHVTGVTKKLVYGQVCYPN